MDSKDPFIIMKERIYTLTKESKNNFLAFHDIKIGLEISESIKYLENELLEKYNNIPNKKENFTINNFFEEVANEYFIIKKNKKISRRKTEKANVNLKKFNKSLINNILDKNKGLLFYQTNIYSLNPSKNNHEYVNFEESTYSLTNLMSYNKFKRKYDFLIDSNITFNNNYIIQKFPIIKRNISINKIGNSKYQIISKLETFIIKSGTNYYKFPPAEVYTTISLNNSLLQFTIARVKGKYKHPLTNYSTNSRSICHGPYIKQYWRDKRVSFNSYNINKLKENNVAGQIADVLITGENLLKKGVTNNVAVHRELNPINFNDLLIPYYTLKNTNLEICEVS